MTSQLYCGRDGRRLFVNEAEAWTGMEHEFGSLESKLQQQEKLTHWKQGTGGAL